MLIDDDRDRAMLPLSLSTRSYKGVTPELAAILVVVSKPSMSGLAQAIAEGVELRNPCDLCSPRTRPTSGTRARQTGNRVQLASKLNSTAENTLEYHFTSTLLSVLVTRI